MECGKLVISLDFELFWGLAVWDKSQLLSYRHNIEGALNALSKIVGTLGSHNMKCTIGVVGAMACSSSEDFLMEAPALRPKYTDPAFSSYESLLPLIGTTFDRNLFFVPETISRLVENPLIEIGSHTFSHYYCLEDGQTIDQFETDIATAVKSAEKRGMKLRTIIFPRNQVSEEYLSVCAKYGFTHYRGNQETALYKSEKTPSRFDPHRVLRFADSYFNLSGHNTYKSIAQRGGLRDVPASRFLRPYSSALRILEPLKVHRVQKSMEYAARHHEIFHLWWHPHNFGLHTDQSIAQLEKICRKFDILHNEYGMQSCFIAEL